jgi:hypothetical protein
MKRIVEGVISSMIYLIHYKNFCKYLNVPPPISTIIKKCLLEWNIIGNIHCKVISFKSKVYLNFNWFSFNIFLSFLTGIVCLC